MNNKLVDGELIALSPAEEQDLVDRATQHAIDQKVYDAQEYARNRKIEYDALNQFELLSDDAVNGTTTYKNAITAIKDKYPKSE